MNSHVNKNSGIRGGLCTFESAVVRDTPTFSVKIPYSQLCFELRFFRCTMRLLMHCFKALFWPLHTMRTRVLCEFGFFLFGARFFGLGIEEQSSVIFLFKCFTLDPRARARLAALAAFERRLRPVVLLHYCVFF